MKRQRGTGGLNKQPESNVWWMRYYRNGRQLRESTGTTDEAQAGKILKKRVAEVTTGTHPGLAVERVRIDELAEDFLKDYKVNGHKSLDDAEARWRLHLARAFPGMKAAHLTTAKLRQYVDDRQKEGAATATINRELAALLRMFYLGHESTAKKVLDVPHFPMLRENNTRTGFPEDRQYQNLVEGAELWLPALIECGSTVGWRHEELISLRVKQVDLDRRILRLEPGTTKNKHAKRQCLWRCCSCSRVEGKGSEDRVFTWPNGGKPVIVRDRCTKPAVPPAWARCTASNAMSKSPTRSCRNALGADAG